jgi:tight adherence protein B
VVYVALPAVAIALAIFIIFFGVARLVSTETMSERLEKFIGRDSETSDKKDRKKAAPSQITVQLDKAIADRSFAANISRNLARADLKLTVAEFLAFKFMTVLAFVGLGIVFGQNLGTFAIFLALIFAVIGFFIPDWYVKIRKAKRLHAFTNQLGDTITLLANSLRSGYSMLQSMEMVARESPPPTSEEFKRVVREVGLGLSTQEAMNNLLRRVPTDDLDLMITAINIQHEVGGNLGQILETISHTIRERVRIRGEIKSLTAMQSGSGYIIAALPVALALVMMIISPAYVSQLFVFPYICMPIGSGIMILVGFMLIRKIVNIEI